MNCPNCGRINPDDTIFCPSCGTAINLPAPKKSGTNIVTIVIAVIVITVLISVVLSAVLYVMVLGIGGSGPPPLVISMTKSISTTNWTMTVVAMSGTSGFALTNMRLVVKDSSGVPTLIRSPLITMISGVYYNGVMFQEYSNSGSLSVGDEFVLDRNQYSIGSTIILTDLSGASQLCAYTM